MFLTSCAKHNAPIAKQTYHDLTSHYNGYFNAKENYNTQLKNLAENRKDNYDQILSISPYGNIKDISAQNDALNVTIEKARLVIQTHQEREKGKNYKKNDDNSVSNWADDAFLIIGQSYYYQGQMDSAISCFRYITSNFNDGVDARSKKKIKKQKNSKKLKAKAKKIEKKQIEALKKGKDIRPKKKLTVHEPANSEAMVWLAKAYIENDQLTEAQSVLTFIEADKNFIKNYDRDVAQTKADLQLKLNSYDRAIEDIEKAISYKKKQSKNARMQFISAQLYEAQNKSDRAAELYKKSIKGNNNFEMIFYAQLKLIQMNRKADNVDKATKRLIAKMLRDNKNRDFYDQLYYEKALIALQDDEREDAEKYLKKSIEVSTNNDKQKAKSIVQLADIYYDEENYKGAQMYYDSSLTYIDSSFTNYGTVQSRASVLTELIEYLNTISLNDSLLALSKLSNKELEALLYKKAVDEVDRQIKEEKEQKDNNLQAANSSGKNNKGSWYFYSSSSRTNGYKKFKQVWGDITLEDNWRRSNKSSDAEFADGDKDNGDEYMSRINATYEAMLEAVPNSEEEKTELKNNIIDAYYGSGVLYKVDLDNIPKSIEMFEKLNNLYASNKYKAEAYYFLYTLYTDSDKKSKANDAKSIILGEFPNSKYASLIKNPNKYNEKEIEDYYDNLYTLYTKEQYDQVITKVDEAKTKFENNPIQAKYDLIKALSIGGKKQLEEFKASLSYVVNEHKNTEEEKKATEILAYLNGQNPVLDNNPSPTNTINTPVNNGGKNTLSKDKIDKIKTPEKIDEKSRDGLKINIGKKEFNIGGKNKVDSKDTKKEGE
ncbi:MAG: tetratricopeptide repeat protein [Chitinophagales bacterium]|nr:tetratricopeptide repeat protein [Chitinophagales bacterium]